MRLVVDTNVFIQASADKKKKYADSRLITELGENLHQLIYTPRIESEIEERLGRYKPSYQFSKRVVLMFQRGERLTETVELHVCSDPDDDKFLECAVTGRVGYIITHDKALRELDIYEGIRIRTPSDFYQENNIPRRRM